LGSVHRSGHGGLFRQAGVGHFCPTQFITSGPLDTLCRDKAGRIRAKNGGFALILGLWGPQNDFKAVCWAPRVSSVSVHCSEKCPIQFVVHTFGFEHYRYLKIDSRYLRITCLIRHNSMESRVSQFGYSLLLSLALLGSGQAIL
jgi:hypothetical protein